MSENNGYPDWVKEVLNKFSSGVAHGFILHGNVSDYVVPGVSVKKYLSRLLGTREIVAFYNRSEGITFATPSMKDQFSEIVGLSGKKDDFDDVLSALGGGSSNSNDLPTSPAAALPLLEKLLKFAGDGKAAVVIEFAEVIIPNGDVNSMSPDDRTNLVTVLRWGRDSEIANASNPIFLVSENLIDLHGSIRAASSKFEAVEIPLPDRSGRLSFIEWMIETQGSKIEMSVDALSNLTAGLSLIHIEDVFLRAEIEGSVTVDLVKERKDSIIASEFGEVIEIVDPRFGFEAIGGLDHVKDFFNRSVIRPMREGVTNRVPMGVLMTGAAGTGKSAVAEAVAFESGLNFVNLNFAKILGQYVGNSERNLEKALRSIKSLSPTIVFIDEIDQTVKRGEGGDSGVSSRLFKRLLEFMSDTGNRGRVMFLAATNRPDLMDAALRRPGRFDRKVPFLVPNEVERAAIFSVMARKYEIAAVVISESAVKETLGWTGAEIEAAVVKAAELIYDENLSAEDAIVEAVRRLSPSTSDIEFMTALALAECNDLDLLPAEYRERAKDRKSVEAEVENLRPADDRRRGGRSL